MPTLSAQSKVQSEVTRRIMAQKSYICNIMQAPFGERHLSRTYGNVDIAACPDGEEFSITEISARQDFINLGDNQRVPIDISADEIAEDACREINSYAGPNSYLGVFVCRPNGPTEEQLADAHAKMKLYNDAQLADADREFQRTKSPLVVNDYQHWLAAKSGIQREWHNADREKQTCPGCGERVPQAVAVCRHCHAVLDRSKARELGLLPEQNQPKRRQVRRAKPDVQPAA